MVVVAVAIHNQKLSLSDHIIELKKRLIYSLLALVFFFIISYYFSTSLYNFLLEPLANALSGEAGRKIIYTNPTEAFLTYMKLAFFSAIFLSLPIIISQIYFFIAPGLYKKEQKIVLWILFISPLLFLLGAALAYYLVLPMAFKFFLSFELLKQNMVMPIELQAKISEYLDLVIKLILAFGLAFQLPILLILLVKLQIISADHLKSKRKYWLVIILIIAAILTPPDVVSQVILALPMILLYEITILIALKTNNKNDEQKK